MNENTMVVSLLLSVGLNITLLLVILKQNNWIRGMVSFEDVKRYGEMLQDIARKTDTPYDDVVADVTVKVLDKLATLTPATAAPGVTIVNAPGGDVSPPNSP